MVARAIGVLLTTFGAASLQAEIDPLQVWTAAGTVTLGLVATPWSRPWVFPSSLLTPHRTPAGSGTDRADHF